MPGKILGLDIREDSITAVQVKSGLKGYQIAACARIVIQGDDGLDGALKGLFEQIDPKSDFCLASIPGEHVSYRNLAMPFKDPKKIRQTLPFEIETIVPFPIEELVVDFSIIDRPDRNDILAASVSKSYVSEYLGHLEGLGIDPEVLDIGCVALASWLLRQEGLPDNGLLLEIDERLITILLYHKRDIVLIRTCAFNGPPIGPSSSHATDGVEMRAENSAHIESSVSAVCRIVQNTIHAHGSQWREPVRPEKVFFTGTGALYPETGNLLNRFMGIPVEKIDLSKDKRVRLDEEVAQGWDPALMNNALALALRDPKHGQGFNFRRDDFELKRDYYGFKKELRKVAVFLILIFSFLAADVGVDYYYLKKRYRILDQKITEIFTQTNPEVTRIVDPVQQLKVKINEKRKSAFSIPGIHSNDKVLDLLRDISTRVPKSIDVRVTRMVIDPDSVRISGKTDTFNTVDSIKNELEPSAYFTNVTISAANLDQSGKRVQFEIKLQRRK